MRQNPNQQQGSLSPAQPPGPDRMPRTLYRVQIGLALLLAFVSYELLRTHAVPQPYGIVLALPCFALAFGAVFLFNKYRYAVISPQPIPRKQWIATGLILALFCGVLIPAVAFAHPPEEVEEKNPRALPSQSGRRKSDRPHRNLYR